MNLPEALSKFLPLSSRGGNRVLKVAMTILEFYPAFIPPSLNRIFAITQTSRLSPDLSPFLGKDEIKEKRTSLLLVPPRAGATTP